MNDTNRPNDSTTPNLRKLFQRLGAVIPDGKNPAMTILPEMSARDALALLDKHDFSQLPVVVGEEVLGLFSYRSFSRAVVECAQLHKRSKKFEPDAWAVADCMDWNPEIARTSDDLHRWFNATSPRDAVLVWGKRVAGGSSFPPVQRPLHIITAFDILPGRAPVCWSGTGTAARPAACPARNLAGFETSFSTS